LRRQTKEKIMTLNMPDEIRNAPTPAQRPVTQGSGGIKGFMMKFADSPAHAETVFRVKNALALATVIAIGFTTPEALAYSVPKPPMQYSTIGNDRGGYVIEYALRMIDMKQSGIHVKFDGRCDSACTLYLALPGSQTCATTNASFRFHLPLGTSPRGVKVARNYMMKTYPGWVRSWINQNGGLSNRLMTMNASYAQKFIGSC
jgi:hypothetical protein